MLNSRFLLLAVLFTLVLTAYALAESPAATQPVAVLSPLEFESRILKLRAETELRHNRPVEISLLVLDRLTDYRSVTIKTLRNALQANRSYESEVLIPAGAHRTYPQTIKFIDAALPWTKADPAMQSMLLAEKAMTVNSEGDDKTAAALFQQAADLLLPLGVEMNIDRIEYLAEVGNFGYRHSQKDMADKAYRSVLSFDWYMIRDPDSQRRAKEIYLRAGRGIIQISRHDLKTLENLNFVPSTLDELGPQLEAAIKEAKQP